MTFYIVGLDRSFPVVTDIVQGDRLLVEVEYDTVNHLTSWLFSNDWTIQGGTQYTVRDVKVLVW